MTIWKFILQQELGFGPQPLKIPEGGEIVHVAAQDEQVYLWALVDPDLERRQRWFVVTPTGAGVLEDTEYLGTAHLLTSLGELVLHVFELQR